MVSCITSSSSLCISLFFLSWWHYGKTCCHCEAFVMPSFQYHSTSTTRSPTTVLDASVVPPARVVIVGGGVGGLALASRLAKLMGSSSLSSTSSSPCNITLLEKNADVGGRCGSIHVQVGDNTFRHERGPSLLLLPHIYRGIFEECGQKTMEEYGLTIEPCLPAYQVVFTDGDCVNVGFPRQTKLSQQEQEELIEAEQISRAQMNSFETDGALKWDAYLQACQAFLDCGLPNFIEEKLDLASFPSFLQESLRDFAKAWPLKPHSDVLDAFFESDKLKALASFQDLYVGLEPYRNNQLLFGGVLDSTAPAVFGLLSAIELHPDNAKCGVYAPVGGFQNVTTSLEALATECGVTIRTGQRVTKVTSDGVWYCCSNNDGDDASNPKTSESTSTPNFEPADLVIVNADLPYATQSLTERRDSNHDPSKETFDWDDRYNYSSGVIAFHWSLDTSLDSLNTHNVFLSAGNRQEAEASWDALRDPTSFRASNPILTKDTPFNFYVHRASKTDPTAAPTGMDSILILVPYPILQRNPSMAQKPRDESLSYYNSTITCDMIDAARGAVFDRLSIIMDSDEKDLRSHIVHEFVDTPATYARQYHVAAGTPFALSHGLSQLSLARPGASAGNTPNVMYVGASSRPGNGVPLVLLGAESVAKKAARHLQNRFPLEN